jgi:hypothetical protein
MRASRITSEQVVHVDQEKDSDIVMTPTERREGCPYAYTLDFDTEFKESGAV